MFIRGASKRAYLGSDQPMCVLSVFVLLSACLFKNRMTHAFCVCVYVYVCVNQSTMLSQASRMLSLSSVTHSLRPRINVLILFPIDWLFMPSTQYILFSFWHREIISSWTETIGWCLIPPNWENSNFSVSSFSAERIYCFRLFGPFKLNWDFFFTISLHLQSLQYNPVCKDWICNWI